MKMKGRKAIAWIVSIIWLSAFIGSIYLFKPPVEWATLFIFILGCFTLITIAFIGGTIWKDWIKSKHFKPELFNGEK